MFSGPISNATRSRYRSRRAVRRQMELPTHIVTHWTKAKMAFVCFGIGTIAMTTIMPIMMIGSSMSSNPDSPATTQKVPVSLHNLIHKSIEVEKEYKNRGKNLVKEASHKMKEALHAKDSVDSLAEEEARTKPVKTTKPKEDSISHDKHHKKNETAVVKEVRKVKEPTKMKESKKLVDEPKTVKESDKVVEVKEVTKSNETLVKAEEKLQKSKNLRAEQPVKNITSTVTTTVKRKQLARGVSGLPMSQTPALLGAQPGHIECDVDVDKLAYWNDPQGDRDRKFVSPFATSEGRYLTFEPDMGGWNNIRMSMEIIFVLAAVTGRILVLPPKSPFYLLGQGKENARSFGNFFPLEHPDFARRVKIMTMEDFVEKERHGILSNFTDDEYQKFKPAADICVHAKDSPINCEVIYQPLRKVGFQPDLQGLKNCLIFDVDHFHAQEKNVSRDVQQRAERFCGNLRKPAYYDDTLHLPKLLHWNAWDHAYRLLNHFYSFLYFTDPKIDNYYKRFVRDFLHYNDNIYCAAGKIVNALNAEGKSWSSLHVRRGDLQYKQVKIPAEEWYNNTKEVWLKDEILFIATDERNKSFFDPIKEHHDLRFLNDYWDVAKLGDLESTFLGMVDTIVASHGRAFAGTWFSTFTGYINRMRGYLGHSMNNSWYSWLPRKDAMQEWRYPEGNMPAREWPLGWTAIDGDVWIEHEGEPIVEDVDQQS